MQHRDQEPRPVRSPSPDDPEALYLLYLTTDVRPAIRAATTGQMRHVLARIARQLCQHLTESAGGTPPLGLDTCQPWQVRQAGTGTLTGFQLYHHVLQAVAGSYLQALGFDPARATADDTYYPNTIGPFLTTARKRRMRRTLLHLASHLDAAVRDSDIAAEATREETGIDCEITGLVGIYTDPRHVILYISDGEVRQEFSVVFTARAIGGVPTPSSESTEVCWKDAAELADCPMDRSMRMRTDHFLSSPGSPHLG